ncbi:DUF1559 domain-containing protein [Blastopirellula marina]|uniref:DUF1559 domain-containing protein n=1 Tax=Blastopirellula marina TaxID=124 RepID=A0A2S8G6P3_9BACT|nr:DUF1559 domain-containing protein [Blastopirellula marina]PQO40083.1 hypothetical protein C5Y98_07160 [Blastopirellula marina]PTL45458.1 DUF1559 domain-containing protein [Blastopirellula marina]
MLKRSFKRRHGFTIFDLIVAIAIIVGFAALVVVGIQKARESSRLMNCTNNLKQIGLGCHNYADTFKQFPTGTLDREPDPTAPPTYDSWGWSALILPQIEQLNVYDALGVTKRSLVAAIEEAEGNPRIAGILQADLTAYRCPSDTTGTLPSCRVASFNGVSGQCPPEPVRAFHTGSFRASTSNYLGNAGLFDAQVRANNGVIYAQSRISFASMIDGTSQTFLVGERSEYGAAGTWVGTSGVRGSSITLTAGTDDSGNPLGTVGTPPNFRDQNSKEYNPWGGFSSMHPGGTQFCLGDGSVRFVTSKIDFSLDTIGPDPTNSYAGDASFDVTPSPGQYGKLGVYQRLGIRNDGQGDVDY